MKEKNEMGYRTRPTDPSPQYDTKLVPKNLHSLYEQVRENNFDKIQT